PHLDRPRQRADAAAQPRARLPPGRAAPRDAAPGRRPVRHWFDSLPDRDTSLSSRWHTEEFRDELRDWCASYVGPVTAMTQQKLRGWATVWRVESAQGVWFAKQNCPGQQLEGPLMAALAELVPDRVVPVTAAADGFLLTPDQGQVFYETAGGDLE